MLHHRLRAATPKGADPGQQAWTAATNGKTDLVVLTTWDGGTNWYASNAGQDY